MSGERTGPSAGVAGFLVQDLVAPLDHAEHDFAEFFSAPSGRLSLTIARWPAGALDDQQPHAEDEVYYVVRGRARLDGGGRSMQVQPGSIVYVAAGVEHRFVEITEDLEVVVFWSPPRHARPAAPAR